MEVEQIPEEDRQGVAPQGVQRGFAATQRRVVDDVVMHEGRRMDQLEDGAEPDILSGFRLAESGGEQHKGWSQTLALPGTHVLRQFLHHR